MFRVGEVHKKPSGIGGAGRGDPKDRPLKQREEKGQLSFALDDEIIEPVGSIPSSKPARREADDLPF